MSLKEDIHNLRNLGYSYSKISDILKCSKSTICYHLDPEQKKKSLKRQRNRRKSHPYLMKLEKFKCRHYNEYCLPISKNAWYKITELRIQRFRRKNNKEINVPTSFTVEDVINKFGENPICYLTGEVIDIYDTSSYHFDHIIPKSKGGSNQIDNLGICTGVANQAKSDMTPDEFVSLCRKVIDHYESTLSGN